MMGSGMSSSSEDAVKGRMCKDCSRAMISKDGTEFYCIVIQDGASIDCDYAEKCNMYEQKDNDIVNHQYKRRHIYVEAWQIGSNKPKPDWLKKFTDIPEMHGSWILREGTGEFRTLSDEWFNEDFVEDTSDGIKLSDYENASDFIQVLMDRSTNPGQMNSYKSDGDYDRIQEAMELSKQLNDIANESNLSLWICTHNGIPQVAVSMGAYAANMAMIFKDGDWVEMRLNECGCLFV